MKYDPFKFTFQQKVVNRTWTSNSQIRTCSCNLTYLGWIMFSSHQFQLLRVVKFRRSLHMLLLLYNLLRSQGPPQYFQETWTYLQTSRLASLGLLQIPQHKIRIIYGDSYQISVARLWNSLHRDIRDSLSLGSFKNSLVKFLKEQSN
uniref:Uncharacterized protein n=1 Tax=Cacopsylla melanoneura TaxID=428564 RepID=A0A8D8THA9_9HEMI